MRKSFLLLLVLFGCGGGGGGVAGPSFAGVWRGTFVVSENTCDEVIPNDDSTLTVNQVDQSVVVDSDSGRTYEGIITSESSFSATRQEVVPCFDTRTGEEAGQAIIVRTLEFSDLSGDTSSVQFTGEEGNCSENSAINSNACRYVMRGVFKRD